MVIFIAILVLTSISLAKWKAEMKLSSRKLKKETHNIYKSLRCAMSIPENIRLKGYLGVDKTTPW